jgi:hypothetical protein
MAGAMIVSVVGHEEVDDNHEKKHMEYIIDVRSIYANWVIKKRYRDFFRFHNRMPEKDLVGVPALPRRKIVRLGNKTPADIAERQNGLSTFIEGIVARENLSEAGELELLRFLEAFDHVPGLANGDHPLLQVADVSALRQNKKGHHGHGHGGEDVTSTSSSPRDELDGHKKHKDKVCMVLVLVFVFLLFFSFFSFLSILTASQYLSLFF